MAIDLEKQIYSNKSICLLGCGSSIDSKNINFQDYEHVVGINRIYQTFFFKHITILYDSIHYMHDPITTEKIKILNNSNLEYYFITPGRKSLEKLKKDHKILEEIKIKKHIYINRPQMIIAGRKVLAGIFVLKTILTGNPKSIDIYGFDFYENEYTQKLEFKHNLGLIRQMHDLNEEKKYLEKILEQNNFIKWHK